MKQYVKSNYNNVFYIVKAYYLKGSGELMEVGKGTYFEKIQ